MWNDFSDMQLVGLAITYGIPFSLNQETCELQNREELEAALTNYEYETYFA